MDDIWRCTAYDPHGIRRCYGDGIDQNEAADQCTVEIMDYLKVRPDLGPLDKWTRKFSTMPALPDGY